VIWAILDQHLIEIAVKPSEPLKPAPFSYRHLVGLLQWLVQCTRPDLAFAARCLAQFLEKPGKIHFQAGLIHVRRYLSNTKHYTLDLGIKKLKSKPRKLLGFSNTNHGGAKEAKSYSGSLIYYQGLIGWRSHIPKSTTLSSAKLELVSLVKCSQEVLWASNLLQENIGLTPTLHLFNDNLSTQAILQNEIYHHGTRHIPFKYYFMQDKVLSKEVELNYMHKCMLPANLMTKNLTGNKIKGFLKNLLTIS
jgi:hypothetical protein